VSTLVLARLRDLFLAGDADAQPARQVAERAVPATLGVLAAPGEADVAAASLALALAAGRRAACAVVCRWSPDDAGAPRAGLATVAARRLAERFCGRGLAAGARGRLVHVALPVAANEARAAAERALAAADEIPVVIVVAGPRPPALDPLLATVDRLVIVPSSDALAGLEPLALTAAAHLGRATGTLHLPAPSIATRLLTTHGFTLPPSLRHPTTAALAGHDA
jgi:hypothetical protein